MTSATTKDSSPQPKKQSINITKVNTACIQANQALALSVNPKDIERCAKVIRQYGLLTPPVVGTLSGGAQLLLWGECELQALRENGAKSVDAILVPIEQRDEGNRLCLLLSSLKKSPNALSEGILITQLLDTGSYTQSKLGEMLGKSVSWVNKRISLVSRLAPAVKELVIHGQLCPHSAQEIARLPQESQHGFSVQAVKAGLPKSAIETLVTAFNATNCPDMVKEQIVSNPCLALERLSDIRSAQRIRRKQEEDAQPQSGRERLEAFRRHMAGILKDLYAMSSDTIDWPLLAALRNDIAGLMLLLDQKLSFSPGKNEKEADIHGH